MSILDLVKNTKQFRKLAYGDNTDLVPYDDVVVSANLDELVNKSIYAGFKKAITDIVCEATKLEIREGKLSNDKLIKIYEGYKKNIDHKFGNVLFVTINPRPDVGLETFHKSVRKYLSKCWIDTFVYVLEQRGTNQSDLGKGFHCHVLLWKSDNKKSHEVIRETKNTFKSVCSVDNPSVLNIKNCKDGDIDKRKNYMLGHKSTESDPTKEEKQKMDIVWRKSVSIEPYYSKNIEV